MFEIKQEIKQDAVLDMQNRGYSVTSDGDPLALELLACQQALTQQLAQWGNAGTLTLDSTVQTMIKSLVDAGLLPKETAYAGTLSKEQANSLLTTVTGLYASKAGTGETKYYAQTLDQMMLDKGIQAVTAQDAVLADLMSQMETQTKNLTTVNDCLQAVNGMMAALANDPPLAYMSSSELEQLKTAIADLNAWLKANPGKSYEGRALPAAITLPDPLTQEALKPIWQQMQDTAQAAGKFSGTTYTACGIAYRASRGIPTEGMKAQLDSLTSQTPPVLELGTIDLTKALDREMLTTMQKNLSTAQSSQGALNEDISLKLNEAASKRSAIFTQLQTLLQMIMQTQQTLARW